MTDTEKIREMEIPHWAYQWMRFLCAFVGLILAMFALCGIVMINFFLIPEYTGLGFSNTPTWLPVAWWLATLLECFFAGWTIASSVTYAARKKFLDNEDDGIRWKIVPPKSWRKLAQ